MIDGMSQLVRNMGQLPLALRCVFAWSLPLLGTTFAPSCSRLTDGAAERPEPVDELTVTASADPAAVVQRGSTTLRAEVSDGAAPYRYRWDQNGGPADIALTADRAETTATGIFDTPGLYVFRVTVTDQGGATGEDFVQVNVSAGVSVNVTAESAEIFEGTAAMLNAVTTDGTEPFTFAWSRERGPQDVDLGAETAAEIVTPALLEIGTYAFRVTVTDAAGFTATDTVEVRVQSSLDVEAPDLATVGEPVELNSTLLADFTDVTYAWEITQGEGSIENPTQATASLTTTNGETLKVKLTMTLPGDSEPLVEVTRELEIVSIESAAPQVEIDTNFGSFTLELDADAAPGYVANFLAYVDEGFYDGLLFHRNACSENPDTGECEPFVLQGGGYERNGTDLELKEPTRDPVPGEPPNGLSNGTTYSVSMALSRGDADSAETQFFINLADNSFLDDQDFRVFAFVVAGRDVIDEIVDQPREQSTVLNNEVSQPVEDVIMETVRRATP